MACFLATFSFYVERTGFPVVFTQVAQEKNISETLKGTIFSAFYYGYATSQASCSKAINALLLIYGQHVHSLTLNSPFMRCSPSPSPHCFAADPSELDCVPGWWLQNVDASIRRVVILLYHHPVRDAFCSFASVRPWGGRGLSGVRHTVRAFHPGCNHGARGQVKGRLLRHLGHVLGVVNRIHGRALARQIVWNG